MWSHVTFGEQDVIGSAEMQNFIMPISSLVIYSDFLNTNH